MTRRTQFLLYLLILAAMAAGGYQGYIRYLAESKNASVELAMGYPAIRKVALLSGRPLAEVLDKFKTAGITSVALSEDTVESLEMDGEISWVKGYELLKADRLELVTDKTLRSHLRRGFLNPAASYLLARNPGLHRRLKRELNLVLGPGQVRDLDGKHALEISDVEDNLKILGLGISPENFRQLGSRGFGVIPRFTNNYHLSLNTIMAKFSALDPLRPIFAIVFDGQEVMGYRDNLAATADELMRRGISYGLVELAEQKGDLELARMMGRQITRVHSITEEEMKTLLPEAAADRWERAAVERSVRLFYVNPILTPPAGRDILTVNLDYVGSIKERLERAGFSAGGGSLPAASLWQAGASGGKTGLASSPEEVETGLGATLLLALGVTAGGLLLLNWAFNFSNRAAYLILFLILFLTPVFTSLGYDFSWRKVLAFFSAVIFPTLAILPLFPPQKSGPAFGITSRGILLVFRATLIAAVGAVIIIGLLADTVFMLGSHRAIGIKLSFILPLLMVAAYFLIAPARAGEKLTLKTILKRTLAIFETPVAAGYLFLALAALGAAAVLIIRSGNFGLPVLEAEKVLRGYLENLFLARPRTKEFLVGYPALFLAAVYYLRGHRQWLWLLATIGAIAPISLVNTFSHIHSPILISILRTLYGMLLGLAVGILVYFVYYALKFIVSRALK